MLFGVSYTANAGQDVAPALHLLGFRALVRRKTSFKYQKSERFMMTKLVKEATVAEVLDVSVSTLRRWRGQGKGPMFRKLIGAVRYSSDDLKQFVDDHARNRTACRKRTVRPHERQ